MAAYTIENVRTGTTVGTATGNNGNEAIVSFIAKNPKQQPNKANLVAKKL